MDLFDHALQDKLNTEAPLAARMRPRTLDEFIGQEEIVGPGRLLRRAIEVDRLFSSIILWGPPGTGKTTLARIIANSTQSHFATISAVLAGVAELRKVIAEAKERRKFNNVKTILFVKDVLETLNTYPHVLVLLCHICRGKAFGVDVVFVDRIWDNRKLAVTGQTHSGAYGPPLCGGLFFLKPRPRLKSCRKLSSVCRGIPHFVT